MRKKNKNRRVYNKKRVKWREKNILYLQHLSTQYYMPKNLLVGIYLIETSFRPWYFRIGEYIFVILGCLFNIVFGAPLKNYTIGKCQIGISSILKNSGKNVYKHVRYIRRIDKEDFLNILKAMHYKRNFRICAEMVNDFYERSLHTANNYNSQLRHIGEEFNGRYSYGLLLDDIVCLLDKGYFVYKQGD